MSTTVLVLTGSAREGGNSDLKRTVSGFPVRVFQFGIKFRPVKGMQVQLIGFGHELIADLIHDQLPKGARQHAVN